MKLYNNLIGFEEAATGKDTFQSVNPATGELLPFLFHKAVPAEADLAAKKAATAFAVYRKKTGYEKAAFLDAIAAELLLAGDELVDTCCLETALPRPRIEGERGRTMNQLRMFAELLREGSWVDARIETALPERTPLPKPDLRYMQIALGPVVVFGASNFPLAFSVAGGDTASALAAGCPVIVKAHSAHPLTSFIAGQAILRAAKSTGMPEGVFSLLFGDGKDLGIQLVQHPAVKAVGFTGSFQGGKALFDAAVKRPEPIPVYAEMGSLNPVFVLPGAMKENAAAIAAGFAASVTLGTGQFCTNPGLLFCLQPDEQFLTAVCNSFETTSGGAMLTAPIFNTYTQRIKQHETITGVEQLAAGKTVPGVNAAQPVLFKTETEVYNRHQELSEEIFGPASVIVTAATKEDLLQLASGLSGHLTATVHGTAEELSGNSALLEILEQKAGRLVINGFPTGVEVCSAMVHGGPYPSTTDSRSTSVGTAAIYRFTRPVCYQQLPDSLLPVELKNKNSLGIYRIVNGERHNNDLI
jgi:2,5-dioxopentanoate dehydrogenase